MVKKALIIVPHGDDEVNLVGTIMEQMVSAGVCVKALFVTNGDYDPKVTEHRMKETIRVTRKMKFNDIYFLGYGDNPDGRNHIFSSENELCKSMAGHTCTYGVKGTSDYRYLISGFHSEYRLNCLKEDMQACIERERANLIFCVDYDSHPDHRMTSLIFDQVIHDIVENSDYRPIVLKKFAYAGTWHGKEDYFSSPMQPTILEDYEYFPYAKQQELRIKVDQGVYPALFWNSEVYKWCRIYRSQKAASHFFSIVNADTVFFYRDTDNLALGATITGSSGETKYLNDFKLYDTDTICGKTKINGENIRKYTWIPAPQDMTKEFKIYVSCPVSVEMLVFYQSHDKDSKIKRIKIEMDNNFVQEYELEDSLCSTVILEKKQNNVQQIRISVMESYGKLAGFREVEIFDHISGFPWKEVPFVPYEENIKEANRKFCCIMQKSINIYMFINKDLRINGIGYFIKRFFCKKYKLWKKGRKNAK